MAIIITDTANNYLNIKDMFKMYNRDYYPDGVYEYIYNTLSDSEQEYIELDVIEWCGNIDSVSIDVWNMAYRTTLTIDELVEELEKDTQVIYLDNEQVYFLAY